MNTAFSLFAASLNQNARANDERQAQDDAQANDERQAEDDEDDHLYWIWCETKETCDALKLWRDRLEIYRLADPETRKRKERFMAEMDDIINRLMNEDDDEQQKEMDALVNPQVNEHDEHEYAEDDQ